MPANHILKKRLMTNLKRKRGVWICSSSNTIIWCIFCPQFHILFRFLGAALSSWQYLIKRQGWNNFWINSISLKFYSFKGQQYRYNSGGLPTFFFFHIPMKLINEWSVETTKFRTKGKERKGNRLQTINGYIWIINARLVSESVAGQPKSLLFGLWSVVIETSLRH